MGEAAVNAVILILGLLTIIRKNKAKSKEMRVLFL